MITRVNIHLIFVTLETFHLSSAWLKDVAFLNIQYIFVTLDTSHLLSGWLKECAFTNILYIEYTLDILVAQNSLGPVCPVPLTVRGIPDDEDESLSNAEEEGNMVNTLLTKIHNNLKKAGLAEFI